MIKHELKQGRLSLLVWAISISFMMAVCILIYPEMATDMGDVGTLFADMGAFSAAFGMDRINFGEFIGFFGVECGNILGLGGAFFAALTGISALAKEEKEHTAEFLFTHPISRRKIITEKLLSVVIQIIILNMIVIMITIISLLMIKETADIKILALLFLSYILMQLETAAVCFGISAFIRFGGLGIGLGLAAVYYFINIISNLTKEAKILKYITPFGYTESADIIKNQELHGGYIAVGMMITIIGVAAAYIKYTKKDIS